jgi:hypothetical protein
MPYHQHNYLTLWEKKNLKPNSGIKRVSSFDSYVEKTYIKYSKE